MRCTWLFILLFFIITIFTIQGIEEVFHNINSLKQQHSEYQNFYEADSIWIAPSLYTDRVTIGKEREMVIYGKKLIEHTASYFGPKGSVNNLSNRMNCQNCHLNGGTRPWGNNFGAVYATYPQYKSRSNTIQNIYDRIKECFQRSLNGRSPDTNNYEIKCMYSYFKWLGKGVVKNKKPYGSGLATIQLINRAADLTKGKKVYLGQCQSCHGINGQGLLNSSATEFIYPPLWGKDSYNDAAGLYRLGSFASFVHDNMPYNSTSHDHPALTIEQAWDVAAYVNSQPRPHKDQKNDWPDITKKPFDAPYPPYADNFSQKQHKYGPYQDIIKSLRSITLKNNPSFK